MNRPFTSALAPILPLFWDSWTPARSTSCRMPRVASASLHCKCRLRWPLKTGLQQDKPFSRHHSLFLLPVRRVVMCTCVYIQRVYLPYMRVRGTRGHTRQTGTYILSVPHLLVLSHSSGLCILIASLHSHGDHSSSLRASPNERACTVLSLPAAGSTAPRHRLTRRCCHQPSSLSVVPTKTTSNRPRVVSPVMSLVLLPASVKRRRRRRLVSLAILEEAKCSRCSYTRVA